MAPINHIPLQQLQKHNTSGNCWIVVNRKVYDVTHYMEQHPGGQSIILQHAGADATAAYSKIHAPSLIEESLPKRDCKGTVSEHDLQHLPTQKKESTTSPNQPPPAAADIQTLVPKQHSKPPLRSMLNAYDFEAVAAKTFSPKAWAYYSSAATDAHTHRLNLSFFSRIWLRPRVLRNVRNVRTGASILGHSTSLPIFVSPCSSARLAHEDGELAVARACRTAGVAQIVSTMSSYPLSQIVRASADTEDPSSNHEHTTSPPPPPPPSSSPPTQLSFLQLYVNPAREQTAALLAQAKTLGIKAIFLTVDSPVAGKREADDRLGLATTNPFGSTSTTGGGGGGVAQTLASAVDSTLSWSDIPWIHTASGKLPLVIKGIQTAADAKLAAQYAHEHGVRGIVLSNHGGRSLDTAQPALLTLLEMWKVCPAVFAQLEVYIDGGVRRGTDVVKALALGASAVGIGRPFLYALAYGQEGVERMIGIFRDEIEVSLRMLGITDVGDLHPGLVDTGDVDHLVPVERGEEGHPYVGRRGGIAAREAKL